MSKRVEPSQLRAQFAAALSRMYGPGYFPAIGHHNHDPYELYEEAAS